MVRQSIAIGVSLVFALATADISAGSKPGVPCKKLGVTKSFKGKALTCTKKGKKFVWSKSDTRNQMRRVATTASPSPAPSQSGKPATVNNVFQLTVHYYRPDGNYDGWNVWLWPSSGGENGPPIEEKGFPFEGRDDFGSYVTVKINTVQEFKDIGFKIRLGNWEATDPLFTNPRYINLFGYQPERNVARFNKDGFAEIWLLHQDFTTYLTRPEIKKEVLPSPSPTPTATSQAAKSLYQRFLARDTIVTKNFDLWRQDASTGKPQSKIEYWFGATVPQEIVDESKRKMDSAVLQWERFHKVSRSKIYFDLAMRNEIRERCEVMRPRSTEFTLDWCINAAEIEISRFFYVASALESEGGWRPVLDPRLSSQASVTHNYTLYEKNVFYTDSFFPRIEHEWIHQIQYDLTGNHYIREYPVWFIEGSAEYLGLLTAAMNEPNYFVMHRGRNWIPRDQSLTLDYFKNWLTTNTVPRLSYSDRSDSLPTDGSAYRLGALATEWLIGKIGFSGLISLLRDTEAMGWASAFEKNVGASQASVRAEIAQHLYAEYKFVDENRDWFTMNQCKSLASSGEVEANKGVCWSGDGRTKP